MASLFRVRFALPSPLLYSILMKAFHVIHFQELTHTLLLTSLLSDNPCEQMCPLCLCSYKLALNNRIVCIPAHKVGRVNKSVCCPRKVSLVDIIVLRLLANLYDNHDALHLHFRWISCFRGHMKGLPCGL